MEATKRKPRKSEQDYAMLAVHRDFHKEVKAFCATNGFSMIGFVEKVLKSFMEQHGKRY